MTPEEAARDAKIPAFCTDVITMFLAQIASPAQESFAKALALADAAAQLLIERDPGNALAVDWRDARRRMVQEERATILQKVFQVPDQPLRAMTTIGGRH